MDVDKTDIFFMIRTDANSSHWDTWLIKKA